MAAAKKGNRNTTAFIQDLGSIDSKSNPADPATLFSYLDRNGDGVISKEEFTKLYNGVKQVVANEHKIASEQEAKLQHSRRRTKYQRGYKERR